MRSAAGRQAPKLQRQSLISAYFGGRCTEPKALKAAAEDGSASVDTPPTQAALTSDPEAAVIAAKDQLVPARQSTADVQLSAGAQKGSREEQLHTSASQEV